MSLVATVPACSPPTSLGELRACRASLAALVDGFDAAALSGFDAAAAVEVACEVERLAGALKLLASNRVVETGAWSDRGAASPARWLAGRSGTSVSDAERTLSTAAQLDALPLVRARVQRGALSAVQVREVAGAAAAAPATQATLLDLAARSSLGELRARCNQVRAGAAPAAADERHERVRRARRWSGWVDDEGAYQVAGRSTVDDGALIDAVLAPIADRLFRTAHTQGRREPAAAYRWDALMEVIRGAATPHMPPVGAGDAGDAGEARAATTHEARHDPSSTGRALGSQAKVIVRIDHAALVRGWVEGDETCDIAGLGPIPVRVARGLLGDAFAAVIITKGRDVHTVAHLGRRATVFQRTALDWTDATCSTLGCPNTNLLEIDHTEEWAKTQHTTLTELGRPCKTCHQKRTRHGWRYGDRDEATGKRPLLPPGASPTGPDPPDTS